MVRAGTVHVDVAERAGKLLGFVTYGPDPEDPACGMIRDTLYLIENSIDLHHDLLEHVVKQLSREGMHRVRLWTLREHFRVRYLYEMYGFRMDGERRIVTSSDSQYLLFRYQYPAHA